MVEKLELRIEGTIATIMRLRPDDRLAAMRFGTYPSWVAAAWILSRVSAVTWLVLRKARETDIIETSASFATSLIVTHPGRPEFSGIDTSSPWVDEAEGRSTVIDRNNTRSLKVGRANGLTNPAWQHDCYR